MDTNFLAVPPERDANFELISPVESPRSRSPNYNSLPTSVVDAYGHPDWEQPPVTASTAEADPSYDTAASDAFYFPPGDDTGEVLTRTHPGFSKSRPGMADPLPSAPPDGVGYSINAYSSDGRSASEVVGAGVFGAEDDGSAGNESASVMDQIGEGVEGEVVHLHRFKKRDGFFVLPNTPDIQELPPGVCVHVEGDIADYPFPEPPRATAGSVGMFALYATGVGYGYYRAANTRLLPGQVMYLQDGSDQYVLAKPGLYFFPGPTRTLHAPVNLGEEVVPLGNTKIITVPPGRVGFVAYGQQVYLLQPGQVYILFSPQLHYLGSVTLNQQTIEVPDNNFGIARESATIARIQAGEFAVCKDAYGHVAVVDAVGRYMLRAPEMLLGIHPVVEARVIHEGYSRVRLQAGQIVFYQDVDAETQFFDQPGTYELRAPAFFLNQVQDVNQDRISVGSLDLVRVKAGQIAIIQNTSGDVDVVDQPGRYELRKPQILLGIYSVNERRIEHGTYERVRLQSGQLVFFQDAEGHTNFYDTPGTYELRRPAYFDSVTYDVNEPVISFGSVVRINLKRGQITFKFTKTGYTELIEEPGIHLIKRPEQFTGTVYHVSEPHLVLGAYTVINVMPGHVAMTYDGRQDVKNISGSQSALRILPEGRHVLDHELWTLQSFRSVQEKPLDLACTVYSRNRVAFLVQAFVLYRVVDPEKAFIEVEHIEDELKREAEATILSVFGAHDSSDVYAGIRHSESAQHAGMGGGGGGDDGDDLPPSYEQSFADVVRIAFLHTIKEFAEARGVKLTRMRVEHMDFRDEEMKVAIQRQAENTVKIEADRRNVEQENQTRVLEAEGQASSRRILADGLAYARQVATEAEVKRVSEIARAQTEASESPLATQLALIKAYTEGQAEIYSALSPQTAIIPEGIQLTTNSLPGQIAAAMGNQGWINVPKKKSRGGRPASRHSNQESP